MIRILILLTALFASTGGIPAARAGTIPQPQGEPTKLYYFEIVPKEQLKLKFSTGKACPNPVHFDRFETIQTLKSAETGESTPVRIIQLYARPSSSCTDAPKGLSEIAIQLGEPTMMTHVYLTADVNLSLRTR